MIQEEINELTNAVKTGGETLDNYVKGLKATEPEIKLDGVKKFLNENDEGKTYLQSISGKRVTEGIETFKKNNLQKLIDEQYKKQHPDTDPKDTEIANLKAQFEQMQKDAARKEIINKALKVAQDKHLPTNLIDYFIGNDEETTKANLKALEKEFNSSVQTAIEDRLKGGYKPPKDNKDNKTYTLNDLKNMSQAEINAHWAEIQNNLGKK